MKQRLDDLPVPMPFRIFVQWCKHDWENDLDIITDEITKVLVIPEIQGALCNLTSMLLVGLMFDGIWPYLKVWASHRLG